MNRAIIHSIGGMKRPKWDPRRFSFTKKFGGVTALREDDYDVWAPLETKNQGMLQICTSEMVTGAAEPQFKTALDECFQFAATKKLEGSVNLDGCDPDLACKAATKFGLLPKTQSPFKALETPPLTFADIGHYPQSAIDTAAKDKEFSFYKVDGQRDRFDSIRAAMQQSMVGNFSTPIMVGCLWRTSWLSMPGGFINPSVPGQPADDHAFVITGQKKVDGVLCLKAHLSSGTAVGDNGFFYFPREVANQFLFASAFAPGTPADYQAEHWTLFQVLYDFFKNLFKTKL